ncbi:MAG: beta strand repeat-containing protein, partial [Bacteroidia bacterium]
LTYDIQSPISATRPAWEFGSSAGNYVIRSSADYTTFTPRLLIDNNGIVQLNNYTTNGLLKTSAGNGTLAIAVAGTDYQAPGNYITALTGDVTATGPGSVPATIANNAVTNAKLADMAGNTVKVNATAALTDPTDLAIPTNNVLGRLAGNIVPIPIGTTSGTIATGDHTHAALTQSTGIAAFSYNGSAAATVALTGQALSLHTMGTGIATITAAGTATPRTITGTSPQIAVTNGNGVAGNPTLAFDYSSTLAGNPTLSSNGTVFGSTGMIFEGSLADGFEGLLTPANPTADRTWTLPDASGTVALVGSSVASFSAGTTGLTPNSATTGAVTLAGTLIAANGGTGFASYTVGDILYANTATTLAKLADVATGNALISGGVGVAPSYGKIGLTTHVSGILPIANGGTGSSTQGWVDLTNIQTAAGAKTWSNLGTFSLGAAINNAGTTAATVGTYPLAVQRATVTDLTLGSDASYAYAQSWNSKPLIINGQGNNVGIGGAPAYRLDVAGGAIRAQDYGAAGSINIMVGDDTYLTDIDQAHTLALYSTSNNAIGQLQLGSNTATYLYGMGGNIGIGTTSVPGKLSFAANGADINWGNTFTKIYDSGNIHYWTDDVTNYESGAATATAEWNWIDGQTSAGASGTTRMQLKNGNLGIGVTSAGARLEVAGQVKITGGAPGAGKVLTSDAAGLASWVTPASGGTVTSVATGGNGITGGTITTTGTISLDYGNASTGGLRPTGNFGQFQSHSTYTDFNTAPGYWGWNYVQGTTNAPNGTSSQWYRQVVSLGSEYPARGAGGYSLELAVPRFNSASAGLWMRTIENGGIGAWSRIDAGGTTFAGTTNYLARWTSTTNLGIGATYDNGTNVGIGNAAPGYKLDVSGDIRSTGTIYADANGTAYLNGGDDATLNDVNVANTVGIIGQQNTTHGSVQLGTGAGAYLYSNGTANIGINTTSPASKLSVYSGAARITGTTNTNAETSGMLIYDNAAGMGAGTAKKVERRTQVQIATTLTEYIIYEDYAMRIGIRRNGNVYELRMSPKTGFNGWWDMAYDAGGDDINLATVGTWYSVTDVGGATLDWGVAYSGGIEYILNREATFGAPTYRVWPHLHDNLTGRRVTVIVEAWYP